MRVPSHAPSPLRSSVALPPRRTVRRAGLTLLGALLWAIALCTACSDSTQPVAAPAAVLGAIPPADPPVPPANPNIPGDENVYVANSDGTGAVRITAGSWPAWAPDGKQILVERSGTIVAVNVDGSGERKIIDGSTPAWSPNGKEIAFTTADGSIDVMNADGTGVRLLVRHDFRTDTYQPWDMGVSKPSWSPDGAHIAFEHLGDGDIMPATAFVVDTFGGVPHRLSALGTLFYAESDPSWSPDGSQIVYWSWGFGIASVSLSDGVPHILYKDFPAVAYGAKPMWSKDGSWIAFASSPSASQIQNSREQNIYLMSASGGPPALLIANAYQPAWSPDGLQIAFVSRHR